MLMIDPGARMSQPTVSTGAPSADIAASPASRCSGLRLASTIDAPRRANSLAMAFPSPVPPPVTTTTSPSKVPGLSAVSPAAGGPGRPGFCSPLMSAPSVERIAALGPCGPELGEVLALVDERLVDQLVLHGRRDAGAGEMGDHLASHLDGHRRRRRDLLRHL